MSWYSLNQLCLVKLQGYLHLQTTFAAQWLTQSGKYASGTVSNSSRRLGWVILGFREVRGFFLLSELYSKNNFHSIISFNKESTLMSNLQCYSKEAKGWKEVLSSLTVLQSLCVQCLQVKRSHHSLALKISLFPSSCCLLFFFPQ